MVQSVFQDAAWYRATTLAERFASRRAQGRSAGIDECEAKRRVLRWRSQPPFANASLFAQRLALDGISEDKFLATLGEPLEDLRTSSPDPAPWLIELSEAFGNGHPPNAIPSPEGIAPDRIALLNPFEPLIAHSLAQLQKGVSRLLRAHPQAPADSETIEGIFFADLPRQLSAMVGRTMVLELNVARLEGALEGDTPEERFRSFFERVHQPEEALAIWREYPVLARQLTIRLDQWVASTVEFLERLCADWDLIRRTFSPDDDPGVLVGVQTNAGDRHRSGRSVSIAKFSSGFRLVYKPKLIAVDMHFQELLTWANQCGCYPPFRTFVMLDRGTYGWIEFIAAETCNALPALGRFYERLGAYLALLYALEATDLHCENLIAAGEHPVLIDLEAIFQPHLPASPAEEDGDSAAIEHSALRSDCCLSVAGQMHSPWGLILAVWEERPGRPLRLAFPIGKRQARMK